jgi:hypothetical protein
MTNKITFRNTGHRLSAKQLTAVEPFLCSGAGRLPSDYRRFLLQYNGGSPEPAHFRWKHKGKPQESEVQGLLGINPGRLDWPGMDCVRTILLHRFGLPKHAVPIANLDLEDLLLLFTDGHRKGQVWHWSATGAQLKGWNLDPEKNIAFVARSFEAFLGALYRPAPTDPDEPVTIALDAPQVRGKQLAAILKSIGCTKWTYPGVRRSPGLPPAWHWPKFKNSRDVRGAAFLSVEKNKTYGYSPKFDERPAGHKMLLVNVTKAQRFGCIRELTSALGERAVIIWPSGGLQ